MKSIFRRKVNPVINVMCCITDSSVNSFKDTQHQDHITGKIPTSMKVETAAQTIWNYMIMGHEIKKSDIILVLGNHDVRTAEYASDLFLNGFGEWLMFSGKIGSLTKGKWDKPEAEVFREVAINKGVISDKIILECEATNTGENIRFSYNKLVSLAITPRSVLIVQTPYGKAILCYIHETMEGCRFTNCQCYFTTNRIKGIC